MAEEPSTKRHHGKTSDKSSNLVDVHVIGEKREYTKTLKGVELHGNEMLEIVCTSVLDKADEVMRRLRMKGGGLYPSFIGVDMDRADHKLWGTSPLPDNLITYAGIYVYAMYKSWKTINNIVPGWDISKEREADPYYHCNFAG
ncbi:hypothetical protein VPH35_129556 [Triticum aestivum]